MEFESKAIVVTVSPDVKSKEKNGTPTGGKFVKCTVKHLDSAIAGKTFFANRTIVSIDQETGETKSKENVKVGQEVKCYNRIVDGQMFTEISIQSQVDDLADILALVNVSADAQAENALSGQ